MISIRNVTLEKNFHKEIHTYELAINNAKYFKFRHRRSDPLSKILLKASKAAEKYSEETFLEMMEIFSATKMEVGSLSSFAKSESLEEESRDNKSGSHLAPRRSVQVKLKKSVK